MHRLYLQTKLANPHYPPEIAAQTTLVNFGVTEAGLEEQLLALVVGSFAFHHLHTPCRYGLAVRLSASCASWQLVCMLAFPYLSLWPGH